MDSFTARSVTYVKTEKSPYPIGYKDRHFFMGSCFSEYLYSYMKERFFNCSFSPFGNIYNPLSLASSLEMLSSEKKISDEEIFENRGLWRHFSFDTALSHPDRNEYLSAINRSLENGRKLIRNASRLYLTLGTAFVYRRQDTGEIVNNCHQLPFGDFSRDCASIEEMRESLSAAITQLHKANPDLKIIMTLSPVRHLRDSPEENSLSKARLRCLIEEMRRDFDFWYFPSYEIMLDQLRDYRWYGADMTHPSQTATDYIMSRFFESAADEDCLEFLADMEKLRNRLNHRILHPGSSEAIKFRKSTFMAIQSYNDKYKGMSRLKEVLQNYETGA